jgi:hypothetical protein
MKTSQRSGRLSERQVALTGADSIVVLQTLMEAAAQKLKQLWGAMRLVIQV